MPTELAERALSHLSVEGGQSGLYPTMQQVGG